MEGGAKLGETEAERARWMGEHHPCPRTAHAGGEVMAPASPEPHL